MNFETFESEQLRKAISQPTWKIFERRVVGWWLKNDPTYEIKNYWEWDKWPAARKYRFPAQDLGIDGVAERNDGELWAVQVKFREDPKSQITWKDVSTFLGLSARPTKRVFGRRVIITNAWQPNKHLDTILRTNPDTLWLGRESLLKTTLNWESFGTNRSPLVRPKIPRPHQIEALENITPKIRTGGRGQVILACGTGKTLLALWIHEKLKSQRTLVLVPTLSLARQTLLEWTANRNQPFTFLTVCSDETVSKDDSLVEVASELGLLTTTSTGQITSFLKRSTRHPRLVFSTYQSSTKIAAAQKQPGVPQFDLVICDEAHKTAGNTSGPFSTVLDDKKIRGKRKLFFTATPRIYGASVKTKAKEVNLEIASMDDTKVYGSVLHVLSFGEAISRNLLSDYQVVALAVTNEEVKSAITSRDLVNLGDTVIDAETLATHIALGKAIKKFGLLKLISFHGRIAGAKRFTDPNDPHSLSNIFRTLELLPGTTLWSEHVSGKMSAGERGRLLGEFRHVEGTAILSNARCLTEGIDVPALDAISFVDPRRSKVDIVQAIGRAIRKFPDKKIGTILIPIIVDEGDPSKTLQDDTRFGAIAAVLKALRAHDERLDEALDIYRQELGERSDVRQSQAGLFFQDHFLIDLPKTHDSATFLPAIEAHIVRMTTRNAFEILGILKRYIEKNGWESFGIKTTSEGFGLGEWVVTQRQYYRLGKLSKMFQTRLEQIPGWSWDPLAEAQQEMVDAIRDYGKEHGWHNFRLKTTYRGLKIGTWANSRRGDYRNGEIQPWVKDQLDQIPGWSWNVVQSRSQDKINTLLQFVSKNGVDALTRFSKVNGKEVGKWAHDWRKGKKRGTLSKWIGKELEHIPGWKWEVLTDGYEKGLDKVKRYVEKNGFDKLRKSTVFEGDKIGLWVTNRRRNLTTGNLPSWLKKELESIPGWRWDPSTDRMQHKLRLLKDYIRKHSWSGFSTGKTIYKGANLGSWVSHQRRNQEKGSLPTWLKDGLESIPGWKWDPFQDSFEEKVRLLQTFVEKDGWRQLKKEAKIDGFGIGVWARRQRLAYNKGSLTDRQIRKLEKVRGWRWKGRFET